MSALSLVIPLLVSLQDDLVRIYSSSLITQELGFKKLFKALIYRLLIKKKRS